MLNYLLRALKVSDRTWCNIEWTRIRWHFTSIYIYIHDYIASILSAIRFLSICFPLPTRSRRYSHIYTSKCNYSFPSWYFKTVNIDGHYIFRAKRSGSYFVMIYIQSIMLWGCRALQSVAGKFACWVSSMLARLWFAYIESRLSDNARRL